MCRKEIKLASWWLLGNSLFITAVAALVSVGDDKATLDQYLTRLKLSDLRLQLHEQTLRQATTTAAKQRSAAQVAELYAQRLLEVADAPNRYAPLVARLQKLTAQFPEVASNSLRVMLMQAEYQRAEALAMQWLDDPSQSESRKSAQNIFRTMLPQLSQVRSELERSIEEKLKLFDSVDETAEKRNSSTSVAMLEKELQREQEILNRAYFFEGWGALFLVVLTEPSDKEQASPSEAYQPLGKLLELSPEADNYEFEESTLGLESVWRARAMLGYATALMAAEKFSLAEECYVALRSASDPAVRDGTFYWQILALLRTRQWGKTTQIAQAQLATATPEGVAVLLPAAVLLVRHGWTINNVSPVEMELVQLGLQALARMKKYEALAALVAKYRPEPTAADGFYPLWMKGRLLFAAAEKAPTNESYAAAADRFQAALALPTAQDDPAAAALCEYGWAWCEYRRQQYALAARSFEKTAAVLKSLHDDAAVQAAWMVFTCQQALHAQSKQERDAKAAEDALERVVRDFPTSEQARRAEYLLAKLKAARGTSEEYLRSLEAVPTDSPNYLSARFDLAVARHRAWSEAKSNDPQRVLLAERSLRDSTQYLTAAPNSEGSRRVKIALLATDVMLSASEVRWSDVQTILQRESAAAEQLKSDDPLAAEYHYRRLQLAQHAGEETSLRTHAAWLTEHARGTAYELPALVVMSKWLEERYQAASAAEKTLRREELIALYEKLVTYWGDSTTVLQQKKNAAVALAKWAQWESEAERYASSAEKWEKLVTAFPTDANYLRRAALAWTQAKQPAKALPHWQLLAAGGDNNSIAWFEAKYHQLTCLLATDPPAARKAWKQFQVLHPQISDDSWRERFATLAAQMRSDAP